jgi:hypothetical protein
LNTQVAIFASMALYRGPKYSISSISEDIIVELVGFLGQQVVCAATHETGEIDGRPVISSSTTEVEQSADD